MPITVEARESVGLDAGMYSGKIVDIIEETGQYGEQVKLVIELEGVFKDNGEPQTQWAWASKTLTPKSKLWKWIKNVSGQTPQVGKSFDVEAALLGQAVGFMVSVNDTGRSVVTDITAGGTRSAPPKSARTAAPAQSAAAPDELCCVPKCGRGVSVYDAEGNAFCERHKPDDAE